ncbi:MAG: hypothetical protein ACOYT4_02020 [Nanoarchaeota archaeon]
MKTKLASEEYITSGGMRKIAESFFDSLENSPEWAKNVGYSSERMKEDREKTRKIEYAGSYTRIYQIEADYSGSLELPKGTIEIEEITFGEKLQVINYLGKWKDNKEQLSAMREALNSGQAGDFMFKNHSSMKSLKFERRTDKDIIQNLPELLGLKI